eukprot:3272814-Pleurochrysis_carterae.AAC.2
MKVSPELYVSVGSDACSAAMPAVRAGDLFVRARALCGTAAEHPYSTHLRPAACSAPALQTARGTPRQCVERERAWI